MPSLKFNQRAPSKPLITKTINKIGDKKSPIPSRPGICANVVMNSLFSKLLS